LLTSTPPVLLALYLCRRPFEIVRDLMKARLDERIGFAMRVVAYLFRMFSKVIEQTHGSTITSQPSSICDQWHAPMIALRPA
jgi:hypothetical protein